MWQVLPKAVLVTQTFACMCNWKQSRLFRCDSLTLILLAKQFNLQIFTEPNGSQVVEQVLALARISRNRFKLF